MHFEFIKLIMHNFFTLPFFCVNLIISVIFFVLFFICTYTLSGVDPGFVGPEAYTISGALCKKRNTKSDYKIRHESEFDMRLTVHHNSMWNRKPTRCHLVLYLFSLFDLAIHPSQPHTNKASCATYSSIDTQPANRF